MHGEGHYQDPTSTTSSCRSCPNGYPTNLNVPVLIIGGGPTGLFMSYLLSRFGVKSLIIERYTERLGAPKAHALCPRSLEICRQFGLDVWRIRDLGTPRADAFWVNFVTNLSGESIGVLPYERMDLAVLDDTPEMIHNVPQPVFEQFITEHIMTDPNVDLRKGVTFLSCKSGLDDVSTIVEKRDTGEKFEIKSKHVIACDGAKSSVRNHLGIKSEGEESYDYMMTIHFNADLRHVVGTRVGMLHWIMDPAAAGFIIAYNLGGNQVLISSFNPTKNPVETWDAELCRSKIIAAIGKEIPFDVLSYRPWILSRKVAKSYRLQNIFLAGDAAHSFPPTGGLGLNSGLADVHNLAYKIAAVHQGWAGDSILDSYESDRRKVAEVNSEQSVKNGKSIFGLLKMLGTTGSDIAAARKSLHCSLADPEKRAMVNKAIEGQREHFDNLELHIGYVYGNLDNPTNASHYEPRYVPGARLPHTWIRYLRTPPGGLPPRVNLGYVPELNAAERDQRQFTVLDLCAFHAFTFILPSIGQFWELISTVRSHYSTRGPGFVVYSLGSDFEVIDDANGMDWLAGTGLKEGGGILIRPDQHILLRLEPFTAAADVLETLRRHLGR